MKSLKFFIIGFFLLIVFLLFFVYADEDCSQIGCLYNETCQKFGAVVNIVGNQYYCDLNGSFANQKLDNQECMNDYECLSGSCLADLCANLSLVLLDYSSLVGFNVSNLCFSEAGQPGCLNASSIANATNTSSICASGEKCFRCIDYHVWNSSSLSCNLRSCESVSGQKCLNFTNASFVDNGASAVGACDNSYNCFKCKSGYRWNASICSEIPRDSGGGDYSGYWIYTGTVTASQFANGYSFLMKERYRLKISILGSYHYVGVVKINANTKKVTINVSSISQQAVLGENENKRFEVTGNGYYDIKVSVGSISSNGARITVSASSDRVEVGGGDSAVNNSDNNGGTDNLGGEEMDWSVVLKAAIISLIVIIVLAIIIILYFYSKKNKGSKNVKEVWAENQRT